MPSNELRQAGVPLRRSGMAWPSRPLPWCASGTMGRPSALLSPWPLARRRLLCTVAVALAHTLPAHALQTLDARDGVAVEAIVSQQEPTRIRIDGAAITDVFGNIHSSHCAGAGPLPSIPGSAPGASLPPPATNPAGDVVVECDRDKGEIYIRPVGTSGKPINLFVSSAQATYTLLLRRADVPADTILIRDRTPRSAQASTADTTPTGPAPSHLRAMKAVLVAMASDRVPPDIQVEETSRALQLWAEARLTLLRLYQGRGLVGEKYLLQNTSAELLVVAEQEFDRADSRGDGQVVGVAIEHHNLRPGETTSVYVIRRGGTR